MTLALVITFFFVIPTVAFVYFLWAMMRADPGSPGLENLHLKVFFSRWAYRHASAQTNSQIHYLPPPTFEVLLSHAPDIILFEVAGASAPVRRPPALSDALVIPRPQLRQWLCYVPAGHRVALYAVPALGLPQWSQELSGIRHIEAFILDGSPQGLSTHHPATG